MSEQNEVQPPPLDELLANALDLTDNRQSYVNFVISSFGINEVILDMYFLGVDPRVLGPSTQAQRMVRVVMPPGYAKEMSQLLLQGISNWEATFGITLPLLAERSNAEAQKKPDDRKTDE